MVIPFPLKLPVIHYANGMCEVELCILVRAQQKLTL